jgi:ABC-2 type transport system permease protein
MPKSLKRIIAFTQKETIQILRDWRTLAMILTMPVVLMFFFAYAVNLLVDHMPTAVADLSNDTQSRAFLDALEISEFFDIKMYEENEAAVIRVIDEGRAKAGVVIPPDFAAQIERGDAQVLVIFDGTDMLTVQTGYSAANAIAQTMSVDLLMKKAGQMGSVMGALGSLEAVPIYTSTRVLYNPDMDGLTFMVPGIAAILLQILTVAQVAMSVVRERELGTLEQLLVTPIRPMELMISKVIPNVFLTIISTLSIILIGVFWFDVPFRGSPWLFAWLSLLFIVSGLGMGLLISTIAQTQKQAQQLTIVLVLLGIMLTGLFYPRSTMPPVVRAAGNLIPVTYFIRIARGIITKGVGISFMRDDVITLAVYGTVVMVFAAMTFKKRLD